MSRKYPDQNTTYKADFKKILTGERKLSDYQLTLPQKIATVAISLVVVYGAATMATNALSPKTLSDEEIARIEELADDANHNGELDIPEIDDAIRKTYDEEGIDDVTSDLVAAGRENYFHTKGNSD